MTSPVLMKKLLFEYEDEFGGPEGRTWMGFARLSKTQVRTPARTWGTPTEL
jgi:hypothetical protein